MSRPIESPAPSLLRLYVEETRALPRGRFALAGAAALLGLLAALAAGPAIWVAGGLWGFGFVAYVVVPSAMAAVVAARVAGARASLFVHGVFTMPVTKAQFLAAGILASLTLGAAYLVATLPFVAVSARHLGDASVLPRFLSVGAAMVVFATAQGTLLGVLFTGRGVAAAAGLAAGAAVLGIVAVGYLAGLVSEGAQPAGLAVRAAHLSPAVLLVGAAGLLPFGVAPASPAGALAAFGAAALGLLALAAWVYLREQGVESWESTPSRRALAALVLAAIVLAPAAIAGTAYEPGGAALSGSVSTRMSGMHATLVGRGADAQDAPILGGRGQAPTLRVGEVHERDLLVILHAAHFADLTDVRVTIETSPGLRVEGSTDVRRDTLAGLETRRFPGHPGPPPVEDYELPVLRIPIVLTPTAPEALARSVDYLHVNATYVATPKDGAPAQAGGVAGPQRASAMLPVFGDVPHASVQMALAGAPFLLACGLGAAARKLRAR